MLARRPRRLISAAAAAAVWAVLAPAPSAEAGRGGDPGRIDRLAASLQARAASAADFGLRTGDPRFLQFGQAANVLANESGVLRAKLAAGDFTAVRVCTAKIGGVVRDIDRLEDRLPKRAQCGRSLRGARKAADRLADGIEDVYDDLEDEVDDLRVVGRVGFAGFASRPVRPAAPSVVVCPTPVRPAAPAVCPGYATCFDPNCDHGFPPGPAAPTWDGVPYGGAVPAPKLRDRDVRYGPSRGLSEPPYEYGRPADAIDGFDVRSGLYGAPRTDFGGVYRDRDRLDPRGYGTPRGFDSGRDRFDLNAVPPLPAPGPQASTGWSRPPLGGARVNVSFRR